MKLLIKPILILSLLINYCFAVCINSNIGFSNELITNNGNTQNQDNYFSNNKFNLLSHLIKNEKSCNSLSKLPNSFEKKQHHNSINDKHSKELFILSSFSNYTLKEKFTFKYFTSTDIIFPFHNFW